MSSLSRRRAPVSESGVPEPKHHRPAHSHPVMLSTSKARIGDLVYCETTVTTRRVTVNCNVGHPFLNYHVTALHIVKGPRQPIRDDLGWLGGIRYVDDVQGGLTHADPPRTPLRQRGRPLAPNR